MKTFIFAGQKGGSGRSVTARLLAHGLAADRPTHLLQLCQPWTPARSGGAPYTESFEIAGDITAQIMACRAALAAETTLVVDLPATSGAALRAVVELGHTCLLPVRPGYLDQLMFQECLGDLLTGSGGRGNVWVLGVDWALGRRDLLRLYHIYAGGIDEPSYEHPEHNTRAGTNEASVEDRAGGDDIKPAIVPWCVPRLSRHGLDCLLRPGLSLSAEVTAAAELLAAVVTTLDKLSTETVVHVRQMLQILPENLRGDFRGDRASDAQKAMALAEDLAAIAGGADIPADDLMLAPILRDWQVQSISTRMLIGRVEGHPSIATGHRAATSQLFEVDPRRTWARTWSRLYRLAPSRSTQDG